MANLEQLRADLELLRQARLDLASGQRVKEVWRDGRRLIFEGISLDDLNTLIGIYESDIAKEEDAVNGTTKTRRRSFGVVWGG